MKKYPFSNWRYAEDLKSEPELRKNDGSGSERVKKAGSGS
jgi:hypothetical protein